MTTFLPNLNRYRVSLQYTQCSVNLPADNQSRNIAKYTKKRAISVNFSLTVALQLCITIANVLDVHVSGPFMSGVKTSQQQDDIALRRVYLFIFHKEQTQLKKAHRLRMLSAFLASV